MKKFVSLLISVIILFSALSVVAAAEETIVLNVYNWGEYIEQSTIDMFEEKYPHIDVNYTTFDSNEAMYSKIVSIALDFHSKIASSMEQSATYTLHFENQVLDLKFLSLQC